MKYRLLPLISIGLASLVLMYDSSLCGGCRANADRYALTTGLSAGEIVERLEQNNARRAAATSRL